MDALYLSLIAALFAAAAAMVSLCRRLMRKEQP